MLDYLKEGWHLECRLTDEVATWTQIVEYNLDWYTNPEKHILTPFDPTGWDTSLPGQWSDSLIKSFDLPSIMALAKPHICPSGFGPKGQPIYRLADVHMWFYEETKPKPDKKRCLKTKKKKPK